MNNPDGAEEACQLSSGPAEFMPEEQITARISPFGVHAFFFFLKKLKDQSA